jgi:chromosomal replication initiator protein
MYTLSRWISAPENNLARAAVERALECLCARGQRRCVNPLFLHGPAGTGKTHLVSALVSEVTQRCKDLVVSQRAADEAAALLRPAQPDQSEDSTTDAVAAMSECDLLVIEDLQHFPAQTAAALARIFDKRLARQRQMVFTATVGPGQLLKLPARLTNRLAGGLVVGLAPLAPGGRLEFLRDRAQRRQLAVRPEVLAWLAENLGGSGRQLEGALSRLEALSRTHERLPDVAAVANYFRTEVDAGRPTVERIAQHVSRYFQVEPRQLQSRRRGRHALLPRQVGMYLARRLTPLSLQQIGAYFGDRDHSTVLHACRKVEQALDGDPALSGAVRQLHAELT